MAPGSEPLSIESLLQKQKEEREAAARVSCLLHAASTSISSFFQPKFLTREDRARIAIAKRSQEIQEEKRKEEENRKNREQLEREAEVIRRRERESKYSTSSSARCRSVSCAHAPYKFTNRCCK
jgi:ATP-dependent RNA helicase DDX23/PRP28